MPHGGADGGFTVPVVVGQHDVHSGAGLTDALDLGVVHDADVIRLRSSRVHNTFRVDVKRLSCKSKTVTEPVIVIATPFSCQC